MVQPSPGTTRLATDGLGAQKSGLVCWAGVKRMKDAHAGGVLGAAVSGKVRGGAKGA